MLAAAATAPSRVGQSSSSAASPSLRAAGVKAQRTVPGGSAERKATPRAVHLLPLRGKLLHARPGPGPRPRAGTCQGASRDLQLPARHSGCGCGDLHNGRRIELRVRNGLAVPCHHLEASERGWHRDGFPAISWTNGPVTVPGLGISLITGRAGLTFGSTGPMDLDVPQGSSDISSHRSRRAHQSRSYRARSGNASFAPSIEEILRELTEAMPSNP